MRKKLAMNKRKHEENGKVNITQKINTVEISGWHV
jgi:hypothetical protein